MKGYFQKDLQINLQFSKHRELLHEIINGNIENIQYESSLLYNKRKPEKLQLIIYYKPQDFLYQKLNFLKTSGVNILKLITPVIAQNPWDHNDVLDFSRSSLIEIKETHCLDQDKKTLIIILDNLELIQNGECDIEAQFKITENIFLHLDRYIKYGLPGKYEEDNKFIEQNENRRTDFGPVSFILHFKHSCKSSSSVKDFLITRDAYLTLIDKSKALKDFELLELGEDLCLLMSFYWEKSIDFFSASLRINDYKTREVFKFTNENLDYFETYFLKDMYPTFYDFAQSVSFEKYQTYKSLVEQAVSCLIRIKNLDDISTFMILYIIIEKVRNFFLSNPLKETSFTIDEEFDFTNRTEKTNSYKEISEVVWESDRVELDSKVNLKENSIKKTGLINRFESFILHLGLNPYKYKVELTEIIRIRNIIYHGSVPNADINLCNNEMKALMFDILLKIISR